MKGTSIVRRLVLLPLALVVLSPLAACTSKPNPGAAGPVKITANDSSCQLSSTTASTGNVTFEVTNAGTKTTEFYLYAEGDRVVGVRWRTSVRG